MAKYLIYTNTYQERIIVQPVSEEKYNILLQEAENDKGRITIDGGKFRGSYMFVDEQLNVLYREKKNLEFSKVQQSGNPHSVYQFISTEESYIESYIESETMQQADRLSDLLPQKDISYLFHSSEAMHYLELIDYEKTGKYVSIDIMLSEIQKRLDEQNRRFEQYRIRQDMIVSLVETGEINNCPKAERDLLYLEYKTHQQDLINSSLEKTIPTKTQYFIYYIKDNEIHMLQSPDLSDVNIKEFGSEYLILNQDMTVIDRSGQELNLKLHDINHRGERIYEILTEDKQLAGPPQRLFNRDAGYPVVIQEISLDTEEQILEAETYFQEEEYYREHRQEVMKQTVEQTPDEEYADIDTKNEFIVELAYMAELEYIIAKQKALDPSDHKKSLSEIMNEAQEICDINCQHMSAPECTHEEMDIEFERSLVC